MSILEAFLATAARRGAHPAIIDGRGRSVSFSALALWSDELAEGWRRKGIRRGDRVLIATRIGLPLYAGLAALWRLGAVAVFPEPALGLKGLRHAIGATRPRAVFSGGWLAGLRFALPELWGTGPLLLASDRRRPTRTPTIALPDDHPALISFTSGSTGLPKAIERTHGFLAAQHAAVSPLLVAGHEHERDLVAFPVFVLVNLALGTTSVLPSWNVTRHDKVEAAALAAVVRERGVTRLLVPPSVCEALAEGGPPPGISAIFTGGGPVFPDVMERLAAASPGCRIVAVYGSTEAEPIAHIGADEIASADWAAMREGAGLLAGRPVPDVALRLIDGEIVVSGAHVNKTYMDPSRNAGSKIALDGEIWHRTGDAGRLDEEGRLWLLGRVDARVGVLHPFGVEAAARFWPGVRRAALAGIGGRPVLAIEGDGAEAGTWERNARRLGIERVVALAAIPLDRRHRSKVDYPALRAALA